MQVQFVFLRIVTVIGGFPVKTSSLQSIFDNFVKNNNR